MASNGNNTKYIIRISRRMYFLGNGEECNFHKIMWCEGGMQMGDIGTNNVWGD